jgi:hypothetical protein
VYGEISELIPEVTLDPLGTMVTLTHYEDANLMQDRISGISVTSILYMINNIPFDWYSNTIKKKMINKIPLDWYSNIIKKEMINKIPLDWYSNIIKKETK